MKVWLTNVQGVSSLKIDPETEAEFDYLANMDTDMLAIRRVRHLDDSMSLNIEPPLHAAPAKANSRK